MRRPTYVRKLERQRLADGRTLLFVMRTGDRRYPPSFLRPDEVPEFEGESAWFEMERVRMGPWVRWRIIRRAPEP